MSKIFKAFREHESSIRRIIAKYVSRPEDVEELTQDAFLKCYITEQSQTIREPRRFLFRAARNIAVSETRLHRNKKTEYLEDFANSDVYVDEKQVNPERQLDGHQRLVMLTKAVASLPEDDQKILLMRKMEQLKFKQIAVRMNLSERAVQKRASKALLKCYAYFKEHGYEAADLGFKEPAVIKPSTESKTPAKSRTPK